MQYVLGNMLNGGGINPDGLSLDLQFAADKTLTARRGPTPTFVRGSGATQVGATGLIEYAPENLMLNSGNVSLMSRLNVPVATSQTGGPLGSYYTLGVDAVNDFHIYRNSGVTPAASASSMMWVLAKRGTARYLRIGGGAASTFDWDTLTFSSISTTHSAGDAVAVGDGWYWLPILRGQTLFIDLAPSSSSGTTFSYNETANVTVEVAAIQVSRSILLQNTAPTYIPTTTAAVYEPRFDHDPVTLACKGLLIEEGRTNLSLQSGVIVNNSGWAALDVTTAVSGTGLDGNNAYKISEVASINIHALANLGGTGAASATSVVSGTSYTGSIFVKKVVGSVDWVQLTFGSLGFGVLQFANFNISNGTIGNSAGLTAGTVPRIEEFSNNWYRISMTAPATATTSLTSNVALVFTNNTDTITRAPSYLGSTSNEVLTSLCQFEAGSFPTSYIPTTTGTLARSADVCTITGADFQSFYNQSGGTMFAESLKTTGPASNSHVCGPSNGSFTEFIDLRYLNDSQLQTVTNHLNVTQFNVLRSYTLNAITRQAIAYALNDAAYCAQGGVVTVDVPPYTPPVVTLFHIGSAGSGLLKLNGCVRAIRYYKKRLPNAKLVTLTT